jgi:chromosome segregation ATPase
MQIFKKNMALLILLTPMLVLLSCSADREQARTVTQPGPVDMQNNQAVARRFQESTSQGPTAVESAIELSEKYAKLSEEAAMLRREKEDLISRNRQLQDQSAAYEAQLRQTQKELTEANGLLIEMRIELNNWKTDILGFRDEIRDAETAQLETLLRILEALGGQVKKESAKAGNTGTVGSAVVSLHKPYQP